MKWGKMFIRIDAHLDSLRGVFFLFPTGQIVSLFIRRDLLRAHTPVGRYFFAINLLPTARGLYFSRGCKSLEEISEKNSAREKSPDPASLTKNLSASALAAFICAANV